MCKSGAGHHQTFETWAPTCSCLLPPEHVNPSLPGRGTKSFGVIAGILKIPVIGNFISNAKTKYKWNLGAQ